MKRCPTVLTVTDNRDAADFDLRIAIGSSTLFNLKTAVEPLLVLHLLESTNTCSCRGFHRFGAFRSSRSCRRNFLRAKW